MEILRKEFPKVRIILRIEYFQNVKRINFYVKPENRRGRILWCVVKTVCVCGGVHVRGHGGDGGDGGGDHVGSIVGRDDLPGDIGHNSVKDLVGHVMDYGLYSRELDGRIILEAKHAIFSQ